MTFLPFKTKDLNQPLDKNCKNPNQLKVNLKFGDGDGPNLCRVKKKQMLVPHLLKIYFGLG